MNDFVKFVTGFAFAGLLSTSLFFAYKAYCPASKCCCCCCEDKTCCETKNERCCDNFCKEKSCKDKK